MPVRESIGSPHRRFTAIAGFSEKTSLPRVAKLRLGYKDKKGEKEFPRESDHFLLDVEDNVPEEVRLDIEQRFLERYGQEPRVLDDMMFISATREEAFSAGYEMWASGKLRCHGDGAEALRRIDGEWRPWQPCANAGCPEYGAKACSLLARLRFMLPDVTLLGYFQIDTGSVYSAANIRDGLNLVEALTAQAFGTPRIHGIPLMLVRAPRKIEHNGKLNTHYILHLTPKNFTFDSLKALGVPKPVAELPPARSIEILEVESDLPEEQVPESERGAEQPDPETRQKIEAGFGVLGYDEGTRASLMTAYAGRWSDLLDELRARWAERTRDAKKKAGGRNG